MDRTQVLSRGLDMGLWTPWDEQGIADAHQLREYRHALYHIDQKPVDIVIFGNSITQGVGDSVVRGGWPTRMANRMATALGLPRHDYGWVSTRGAMAGAGTPIWRVTNTSGASAQSAAVGHGLWNYSIRPGDIITLEDIICDRIELFHTTFSTIFFGLVTAAQYEVSIDGVVVAEDISTFDGSLATDVQHSHQSGFISDALTLGPGSYVG